VELRHRVQRSSRSGQRAAAGSPRRAASAATVSAACSLPARCVKRTFAWREVRRVTSTSR
jgi:hypothetical protein